MCDEPVLEAVAAGLCTRGRPHSCRAPCRPRELVALPEGPPAVAEAFVTRLEAQAPGTPALSAGSLRRGVRSLPGSSLHHRAPGLDDRLSPARRRRAVLPARSQASRVVRTGTQVGAEQRLLPTRAAGTSPSAPRGPPVPDHASRVQRSPRAALPQRRHTRPG